MISFLITKFSKTPVYIVLTTHLANPEREKRVIKRNTAALEIAGKYGLDVIDIYSVTLENADLLAEDGAHFTKEGYEKIAEKIIETISI